VDVVEFLISANPGEPLRPLARIASGGETSRIMLAIKSVLSTADQVPTLVFDEVDAGIGGRMGAVVGGKLWRLSRQRQVLCVTHLPQLAAFAENHLYVAKTVVNNRTLTSIHSLSDQERVQEIGQMLGGTGARALQNAQEILAQARASKS
jgi:DNA repair protein RecN (Recombination protein N)